MKALLLLALAGPAAASTSTLTVSVIDSSGTPLAGVQVPVVTFDPATGQPSTTTELLITGAGGSTQTVIVNGLDYFVGASTPGYLPTYRDQFNEPRGVFFVNAATDVSKVFQLFPFPAPPPTLGVTVSAIPAVGDLLLAEVFFAKTREPVVYGIARATATTSQLRVFNMPALPAGALGLHVSVAGKDKALEVILSTPIPPAPVLVQAAVDLSSALPPVLFEENLSTQTAAIEGIIVSTAGAGIEGMRVEISSFVFDPEFSINEPLFRAITLTDKNGRFNFFNVPFRSDYQLSMSRQGFEGVRIHPIALPPAGPLQFVIPAATYTLTGTLIYAGQPSPWGELHVFGDGDHWLGSDSYAGPANRSIRGDGRATVDGNGNFVVDGLTDGNLNLDAVFRGGAYKFTAGANQQADIAGGGERSGDDRRITISSVAIPSGGPCPCPPGTVVVRDAAGVVLSTGPVIFNVVPSVPNSAGVIFGTVTFISSFTISASSPLAIPSARPVIVLAAEDFQGGPGQVQKLGIHAISGVLTDKTTTYSITVATGSNYHLEVLGQDFGALTRFDNTAVMSVSTSARIDFLVTRSGSLRGQLKLPDGRDYRPRYDVSFNSPQFHAVDVELEGINTDAGVHPDLQIDGTFSVPNLAPGLYRVRLFPEGKAAEWPPKIVENVLVRVGEHTELSLRLEDGLVVQPQIVGLPSVSTDSWRFSIVGVPAGTQLSRRKLSELFFNQPLVSFQYSTNTATWTTQRLRPGSYDFHLVLGARFEPDDEVQPSFDDFADFIGSAKGVSIQRSESNPQLGTPAQPIPLQILGSVGQAVLGGTVEGSNLLTTSDLEKIIGNFKGQGIFLLPAVLLYDNSGDLRGFAHAFPSEASFATLQVAFAARDPAAILAALTANPLEYLIGGLPPGKYTEVFLSPNYPPVAREVELPAGEVQNIDFDQEQVVVGQLSGVVRSSGTLAPIPNASVQLKHRTVEKLVLTDPTGAYSVSNLPPGIYRIEVSKPGFVTEGSKVGLSGSDALTQDFVLVASTSEVRGTVYTRKFPTPLTREGVRIVAYDETKNVQQPDAYLPRTETQTRPDGTYVIPAVVPGHVYKVTAVLAGKVTQTVQVTAGVGVTDAPDILLRDAPPEIVVRVKRNFEQLGKVDVLIESPKELRASPSATMNPGQAFSSTAAVSLTLSILPDRKFLGQFTTTPTQRFYAVRVTAGESGNQLVKLVVFDQLSDARSDQFAHEQSLAGGSLSLDSESSEFSGLELDPGSLTLTTAAAALTSGLSAQGYGVQADTDVVDFSDLVGGFFSALPSVRMVKTDRGTSESITDVLSGLLASEVYEIDLENAQQNKTLTLTLNYDKESVTDTGSLRIYQYDAASDEWQEVPGDYTVDPTNGVVSVEVESLEEASEGIPGTTSPLGAYGRASVSQGVYVPNQSAATSQSGTFAVFQAKPPTGVAYAGSGFEIYNMPNPFDLKSKTLQISSDGTGILGSQHTLEGTLIKYHLPASVSGRIKLLIYNVAGELVRELDEGSRTGGQIYYSEWDGRNERGEKVASGVYFLLAQADGKKLGEKAHKMALIK